MQRIARGCTSHRNSRFCVFLNLLKKAFFVTCVDDVERVKDWLRRVRKMTDDQIKELPASYFEPFVRRSVPLPSVLRRNLDVVYKIFANVTCEPGATEPLFRAGSGPGSMRAIMDDAIRHINLGCVSDPPGMSMYNTRPTLSERPELHSIRGTSDLENFHLYLKKAILHSCNLSPEVSDGLCCT